MQCARPRRSQPSSRPWPKLATANVARTYGELRDLTKANALFDEAVDITSSIKEPARRSQAWTAIARAMARLANSLFAAGSRLAARAFADNAETVARSIDDSA